MKKHLHPGNLVRLCALALILAAIFVVVRRSPAPPTSTPPLASGSSIKLLVRATGIYRITAKDLLDAGWNQAMLDPAALALTYDGKNVPVHIEGQKDTLALTFYGRAPASRYTPYRAYWLASGAGLTPMSIHPIAPATASTVTITQHFERDTLYASRAPSSGDHWFWQTVTAPRRITFTLKITSPVPAPARLTLAVWGATADSAQPDHHIQVLLNAATLGEHKWDGMGERQRITLDVPSGTLRDGNNTLAIALPGDTGASADTVLVDWIELAYASSAPAPAEFESAGIPASFADNAGNALIDITDPLLPAWIQGPSNQPVTGPQRYAVAAAPHLLKPEIVPATISPDWRAVTRTDYLIIADPSLRAAAMPLIEWRASQGLSVTLVTTAEAYDQFGRGEPDPAALRALIKSMQPRYVLLLGDATYDYRNVLGKAPAAQVLSPRVNAAFSGETTSDAWLADIDQDGLPDAAVGRLPAQNADEAKAMIARTIEYEKSPPTGDWRKRVLMVADPSEPGFARTADDLVQQLPQGQFDVTRLYQNDPPGVVRALDDGSLLTVYVGHGSLKLWGKDGLLTAEAVDKLSNGSKRPLVINFTCLTGYIVHPTTESLGERLLRTSNGGAVAAIAPSSLTLPEDQLSFAQVLLKTLGDPTVTIGEALLRAQRESTSSKDVTLTYTLLGDPTLKLAR
jgi:hypothetical protein